MTDASIRAVRSKMSYVATEAGHRTEANHARNGNELLLRNVNSKRHKRRRHTY